MKKKYLVLIALTVAVTSFSIDPSHARRRGGTSFFAAKPAPVATPAAKPTPAAATRKDDAQARTHFHVAPRRRDPTVEWLGCYRHANGSQRAIGCQRVNRGHRDRRPDHGLGPG